MEEILRIVMEAVAILVGTGLLILIKRATKKYGFELKGIEERNLLAVMTRIVLHVEEEDAKFQKSNGKKSKGREKLSKAIMLFSLEEPGHPAEKAVRLAHEALFVNGIGATNASVPSAKLPPRDVLTTEGMKSPRGNLTPIKTGSDECGGEPG